LVTTPALLQQGQWTITPYAWLAGFDGTLGTEGTPPGLSGRVDVDTRGFRLKQLGGMLNVNWRQGRVTAFGDWTYANTKADSPKPFAALYAGADVKARGNIVETNIGYDLLGAPDSHVDVFGDVRFYDLHLDLALRQGILPGATLGRRPQWADEVHGRPRGDALRQRWGGIREHGRRRGRLGPRVAVLRRCRLSLFVGLDHCRLPASARQLREELMQATRGIDRPDSWRRVPLLAGD
jgi:hypothetical protein